MTVLVPLGLRLARAGGWVRAVSVITGNAVGVLVLLLAVALPSAAYPDRLAYNPDQRSTLVGVVIALVVPVAVLLLTVGRLSSAVRDRRLASLRVIGLGRSQTQTVAAVENAALALAGALVGWAAFVALAPVVDRAVAAGPKWFVAPLAVPPLAALGTVVGVTALSALVSLAPTRTLASTGRGARSESTRRRPSPWRLVVLVVAVAALVVGVIATPGSPPQLWGFLSGALLGAVAIAMCTPVLTTWSAGALTRSRSVSALLAGRGIQAEPASAARLVAGIGVATFLVAGAAGVLAVFEDLPQFRYADQMLHDGPQVISARVSTNDGSGAVLSAAQGAALESAPGVDGLVDRWNAQACDADGRCASAFVGTCAQLELTVVATGCDDEHAALISPLDADVPVDPFEVNLGNNATVTLNGDDTTSAHADVALDGIPIVEDVEATTDRWVYPSAATVFVPARLIPGAADLPRGVDVIAQGGTDVQAAVTAAGAAVGVDAMPYSGEEDISQVMQVRAIVWSLSSIIIGIALITVALGTIDRALERRRAVARQIAVGVPARVLRRGQLLQTLLPLGVAILLATGCGALLMRGYLRVGDLGRSMSVDRLAVPLVASLLGAAVVSLATVPLIRTRLDPRLLRSE